MQRILLLLATLAVAVGADSAPGYAWKPIVVGGGGYVTGLVINQGDPRLKYIRTDVGGAYRWDNDHWTCLTDALHLADARGNHVESIATAASDPDTVLIAIGSTTSRPAGCVYRSGDRGRTWQRSDIDNKVTIFGNALLRQWGERLAIDPYDSKVVWLGSRCEGLWRSGDGGLTFQPVPGAPKGGERTNHSGGRTEQVRVGVCLVMPDPHGGRMPSGACKTVYLSAANDGVFRSRDGGTTWAKVEGLPDAIEFTAVRGDIGPDGAVWLGFSDRGEFPLRGSLWKLVGDRAEDVTPSIGGARAHNKGWGLISVSRHDPKVVVAFNWQAALKVAAFRSGDGGATWTVITPSNELAPDPAYAKTNGWWIGPAAVAIDPEDKSSRTVWMVNGVCPWRTTTQDAGPARWEALDAGHDELIYTNFLKQPGRPLLSNVMDQCGYAHTDLDSPPLGKLPGRNAIEPKKTPDGHQGMTMDHCESDPRWIFRGGFSPYGSGDGWLIRSQDFGATWSGIPDPSGVLARNHKIAVACNDPANLVLVSASNGSKPDVGVPRYSTDGGASWKMAAGLPSTFAALDGFWSAATCLVSDRVRPNTFYLRSSGETGFYRSTDGGATFIRMPSECGQYATELKAIPGVSDEVWANARLRSGERVAWRTRDGGVTWAPIPGFEHVQAFGFGAPAPGRTEVTAYVVGKRSGRWGVYRSTDIVAAPAGAAGRWVAITPDVLDLPLDGALSSATTGDPEVFGLLYIGTGGRGAWYGRPTPASIPPVPSDLRAVRVGADEVRVGWSDVAGDETSYQVERKASGAFASAANLAADSDGWVDRVAGATTYRVRTVNAAGASTWVEAALVSPVPMAPARIDFGPADAPLPADWRRDAGAVFADSQGFGWSVDAGATARRRNKHADPRYDTRVGAPTGATWELAVAPGWYRVQLALGDAEFPHADNGCSIEGMRCPDRDGKDLFDEAAMVVAVTDGRLTVRADTGGASLAWIEVTAVSDRLAAWRECRVALGDAEAKLLPTADLDGDGLTNAAEFARGSDPTVSDLATIVVQPAATAALPGQLWVIASGPGPLRYQWHRDGVAVPNATGASVAAGPGRWDVEITNPVGAVRSTVTEIAP